jgi:hypothetical protein
MKAQDNGANSKPTVDCQVVAAVLDCEMLYTCMPKAAALSTDDKRPEKLYYDAEESIHIQIVDTVICGASDINPGNKQQPS